MYSAGRAFTCTACSGGGDSDKLLLPLTNKAGTITRYFFCISPAPASLTDNKAYCFAGDFDKETGKFIPDERFDKKAVLLVPERLALV